MKKIKIASMWNSTVEADLDKLVITNLIKILSKKEIEFVPLSKCDLVIFGPYESQSILNYVKRRTLNSIKRRVDAIDAYFPNIDFYLLNRKIKPIKIFLSWENYGFPNIKYDFAITSHLGINDKNHLRFPFWKEVMDWSHLGIQRELSVSAKRFGSYYKINDLMNANGNKFISKNKKVCLFATHLHEPRKSLYSKLSEHFVVDGYGPYFNKKIKNHNFSNFNKKDVMKNYGFNLCPENSLSAGLYNEKVPDAFLGSCLPITWADNNINHDFNEKSFVNLLNYAKDNYEEICNLLKDENFLKKHADQPLLLKEPSLNNERNFINKIISCL
jgi:hypothetical protein